MKRYIFYLFIFPSFQKTETSREARTCVPQLEDYYECLHHRKEKAMVKAVHDQLKINAEQEKLNGNDNNEGH
jgi:hypothetical protein